MEGQLNFKAIFIGFIVDIFATQTIGGLIGGVVGGVIAASAVRGGIAAGPAAGNALVIQQHMMQQISTLMNLPTMIVATILSGVLGSLIGGYITGLMARGAETKNAAAMGAFGLLFALLMLALAKAMHGAGGANSNSAFGAGAFGGAAMPTWVPLISCLLTIPAAVCGGALCSLRSTPAPREENLDRFNQ